MNKFAAAMLVLLVLVLSIPQTVEPAAQDRQSPFHAPDTSHWLGTDGLGRDVLTRVVAATRLSLTAGLLATVLALSIAVLLGAAAGCCPVWIDEGIMRICELFQSLPWIYFVLGVRALLPLSLSPAQALFSIALVAGFTGWPRPARLIRGVVLESSRRDYVTAARRFGAGPVYLLRRHIIPDTAPVIFVQAALLLPQFILVEVTLSFLGLGIGEPSPSLGAMLSALRDLNVLGSYPWMLAPAVVLLAITMGCQTLVRFRSEDDPGLH